MARSLTKETQTRLAITKATSPSIIKDPSNSIKGIKLTINQGYQSQGHDQGQEMCQPRIDFGMVLPAPNFGLEQFLEMTKALK